MREIAFQWLSPSSILYNEIIFYVYADLERILHQHIQPVGMAGCGTEISAPSSQIFNADLQIAAYIPESIGYQILSFTIGFGILTRVSIFRIKSGQTVCSGYKDARAKIVLQSCIPSQHRKNLHFSFLVGIGDDIYVQVA